MKSYIEQRDIRILRKNNWNKEGIRLLIDLQSVPSEERYTFILTRVSALDPSVRELVANFVIAAFDASKVEITKLKKDKHRIDSISGLAKVGFFSGLGFALIGVLFIATPLAASKIEVWGFKVETQSTGIAAVALGVILALFTARTAIKNM